MAFGRHSEGRTGSQHSVTEVSLDLDQVGIVVSVEMPRLVRASRDWYQLLEDRMATTSLSLGEHWEVFIKKTERWKVPPRDQEGRMS